MLIPAIRDGTWMTPARLRIYPMTIFAMFLVALTLLVFAPNRKWSGVDFVGFWAPANLAATGHAADIYDQRLLQTLERNVSGRDYPPWPYPPTYLLMILPLGWLSYAAAFIVWETVGLAVYWLAIRRLAGPEGLMLAFSFPGVLICIVNGHAEFLLAGLFGGAMILLDRHPYVAGLLIGLCTVKPHLFLLVPVALIAGGHWRAMAAAGTTLLLYVAASIATLGPEIWGRFLSSVFALGGGYVSGTYLNVVAKQQSAFAFGLPLGGPVLAAGLQIAAIAFAGWAVAMTWKKNRPIEERSMILCCGTLLATPYLFDWDLVLLAVPIALLGRRGLAEGFLPWRKSLLGAMWVAPALGRLATYVAHVPATVILLVLSITMFVEPYVLESARGASNK